MPSYDVTDLTAGLTLGARWSAGISVNNLFDDEHYEMFGGDLLGRRALLHFDVTW